MATIESTLRTVIVMQDAMTPVISSILNATNLLIDGFSNLHGAAGDAIPPGMLEGARREIANAGAAWRQLQEQLNRGGNGRVEWGSAPQMPVFQTQGLARYRQETEAARVAMANLTSHQSEISRRAQRTQLFSGAAVRDLTSVQDRINALSQNVDRLASRRVGSMGAQQASAQMEALRSRMQQARQHQEALNEAVRRMDVGGANAAYQRLIGTVQNLEREVRDSAAEQSGFNDAVGSGAGAAGLLSRALHGLGVDFSVQKLVGLSDSMAQANARISLMNDGLQTNGQLQQLIYQSAQRARAPYLETAQTVSRLGTLAKDAFGGNAEMIFFAEQMNKQFALGGASVQEQSAAMYQLTQAMGTGRLQGDEFLTIMKNAPLLAQSIAEEMGVTTDELRGMSGEGLITADVLKNALFHMADETNARFEAMPMTWSQVLTSVANRVMMAMQPLLSFINLLANNWGALEPVVIGVAAALGAYALALGISTAAKWLASAAAKEFFSTLLTNPFMWIALLIGVVVAAIYKWVQSVGGLRIAWLITQNVLLSAWDAVKTAFFTGIYGVMDLFGKLQLAWRTAGTNIQNWAGDMKAGTLMLLQGMVNGAIDIINQFIGTLNTIPGVSIDTVANVTFGSTAQLENEAAKKARNEELEHYRAQIESAAEGRAAKLEELKWQANLDAMARNANIISAQENSAAADPSSGMFNTANGHLANIADNTGAAKDSLELGEEEIKYMRILAEREAVNRFTTAEIRVDMGGVTNNVGSNADFDGFFSGMVQNVESAMAMAAEGC